MVESVLKVKSADRVMDVLELFAGEKEAYNLTEIATLLNMPSSSAYRILQNMLNRGYLETDRSGKLFRIGYKIFEIRTRFMKDTSLTSEFYQVAEKIVDDLNEVVFLGIRAGSRLIYIAEKQIAQPLRFSSHFGKTLPLYASASGKVLLANLTAGEIEKMYEDEAMTPLTDKTITTVEGLLQAVAEAKKTGLAYNMGESVGDVHCVAGPIYDTEGTIVAAISISIPTMRITDEIWERAQEWIRQGCRELSYKVYLQN